MGVEIRKRIDVVIQKSPVAGVDTVFDSPDVDFGRGDNALHCADHFTGRLIWLNFQSGFRAIGETRRAVCGASKGTNFGRAEIQILAASKKFHRLEKLSAKRFHAGDVSIARW